MNTVLRAVRVTILAVLAAVAGLPGVASAKELALDVMTWNVRLDLASDGANAWPHRRAMFAGVIRFEGPDIIGMQEVLDGQRRDILAALPAYASVGVGRDDGASAGEYSPIFYRRDRFSLLASGTFWLSETPDRLSMGWDAAYPRIATWAHFRDRESRQTFWIVNTHLDHVGKAARLNGATMLRRWMAAHGRQRELTVLTGDFNAEPDAPPMLALTQPGDDTPPLLDARRLSEAVPFGPAGTFTGFDIAASAAAPIDHILLGRRARVLRYGVLAYHFAGRLPSDHYPVMVSLRWAAR